MSRDIHVDQVRQPLLIIAKTQVCPDTILSQLPRSIPNVVRFDGKRGDPTLIENAVPSVSDTNYGQHQQLERQLDENQRKLNALLLARFKASEHDPVLISTAIPTDYLYHMNQPNHSCTFNFVSLWSTWAGENPKIRNFSNTQEDREEFCHAQSLLENNYLKDAGRDIMQTLDTNDMKNRFNGIGSNPVSILPIADSFNWPFEISARTSEELRTELANVWELIPTDSVWNATDQEKAQIIESLANILVTCIDYEIDALFQDRIEIAKEFDDNLTQTLTDLCQRSSVIALTADFAVANRVLVSCLRPRAIIVDDASEILESTLASTILGTRAEHLVLLGNNDNSSKPHLNNTNMTGDPHNLDVSLFERCKGSGCEMELFSFVTNAHIAYCNENMVDGRKSQEETMRGIKKRTFYLVYQAPEQSNRNHDYFKICKFDITDAEVEKQDSFCTLRFTFFNVTLNVLLQFLQVVLSKKKKLIVATLNKGNGKISSFASDTHKIIMNTVEQNAGRQDSFTIVSTATPAHSFSTLDNVSHALTRARYGLFVIGNPERDNVNGRGKVFANYMKTRGLFATHMKSSCFEHGDTFTVEKWQDFDNMRNGGCFLLLPLHSRIILSIKSIRASFLVIKSLFSLICFNQFLTVGIIFTYLFVRLKQVCNSVLYFWNLCYKSRIETSNIMVKRYRWVDTDQVAFSIISYYLAVFFLNDQMLGSNRHKSAMSCVHWEKDLLEILKRCSFAKPVSVSKRAKKEAVLIQIGKVGLFGAATITLWSRMKTN
ncbi:hypothetical protein EDC94DRAFT_650481 [Helicostylum pulchrum]|nr:hypothetical protein EDC94DRAFT_650481 [Helicostylum pulchrum]